MIKAVMGLMLLICVSPLMGGAIDQRLLVIEGDILLTDRLQALTVSSKNHYWVNGLIPFQFSESLPLVNKQAALDAMDYWQRHTNVTFEELTPQTRGKHQDYVVFVPEGGQLCASFVGRRGGRQDVFLSPRCDYKILLHELGHVLGLWHEQSRSDRDQYVRIIWENIQEHARYNFEKRVSDGIDYKEYDYHSIMHYSPYAFSKNGRLTIEPLLPGITIGQQYSLSNSDIAAVNAMYPGPLG